MPSDNRIKIAFVIDTVNFGGAENQALQIAAGLDPARYEKYMINFRPAHPDRHFNVAPEIRTFVVPRRRWGHLGCVWRLARLLKRLGIHVIHSHMFQASLFSSVAARLAGVRAVITTEHGKNSWKTRRYHLLERWVTSRLADYRVAVSEDIRRIRVEAADIPENKIGVIPNCVEIPARIAAKTREGKPGNGVAVGTVGRMVAAKDYGTLLSAFARLCARIPGASLLLAGDGPERGALEEQARRLGISRHVRFLGFKKDIPALLDTLDVFVLSSIREGIPVAMLEAMAAGVPVVATRVGGIPEVVEDGRNGLLVDSRDPEGLARSLERLIKTPALGDKVGAAGRDTIQRLYSRENICARYETLYTHHLKAS